MRFLRHAAFLSLVAVALVLATPSASAQDAWTIRSFAATYTVAANGVLDVVETIEVDFGSLQRRGIFRDIPVRYTYDERHDRLIDLEVVAVDNGTRPWQYVTMREGGYFRIRIGNPDVTLSGPQTYRIHYRVEGALNAFEERDELYWNVTGDDWEVVIQRATATVAAPAIDQVACFQGPLSSYVPCNVTGSTATAAGFAATRSLPPGSGLTIVVGFPKGSVAVPPPRLERLKTPGEQVRDFLGLSPLPIAGAVVVGALGAGLVGAQWWRAGRDRWLGDVQYLTGQTEEETKPLFARETVVPEFTPPTIGRRNPRRLRPAEIGVLIDERAHTLDVSATIVDLAVRGYLRIVEIEKTWLLGKADYRFERLQTDTSDLLPFERTLFNALFEKGEAVEMSDLRNTFYDDLARTKKVLYTQVVKTNHFFPSNPETVRTLYLWAGLVIAGVGGGAIALLGSAGAGIIGIPIVLLGLVVAALSGAMPRRTGGGRETLRRALGFREYLVTAEKDRARFAEEIGLFSEYLPYAIVFDCTQRWARAFEGLASVPSKGTDWYVSRNAFAPLAFTHDINSFSSSISRAIASTPSSSGGSGFSGGGSSGGGMGGGGGGSW